MLSVTIYANYVQSFPNVVKVVPPKAADNFGKLISEAIGTSLEDKIIYTVTVSGLIGSVTNVLLSLPPIDTETIINTALATIPQQWQPQGRNVIRTILNAISYRITVARSPIILDNAVINIVGTGIVSNITFEKTEFINDLNQKLKDYGLDPREEFLITLSNSIERLLISAAGHPNFAYIVTTTGTSSTTSGSVTFRFNPKIT